eukprot:TRINITY_DN2310_c0_g3_i2.p1 TRINITY_DN2310_c0_g3~~TRINITY_DN2310_c0_g3_i2.p1  ORF type:complete len:199 (+),score=61.46 TRINITY_DN2310_c0_g3_i2:97-693(+)
MAKRKIKLISHSYFFLRLDQLELFVGTAPNHQRLQLRIDGVVSVELNDDSATLGSYNPADLQELHVVDEDPNNEIASLQDISKVEKYVMSEESYNARETTYRKWKEEEAKAKGSDEPFPEHIQKGDRVTVPATEGVEERHGEVAYVGTIDGSKGYWIGIKFDGPNGKNDGSLKGKRYFQCEENYGGFVKPNKVILASK